jgi:hypothetical protein
MEKQITDPVGDAFLVPIGTIEQMHDWFHTYLDMDFPMGHIDPDSNSSPVEWMFEAYTLYRENRTAQIPGLIVLSSRESYKTLTESAFAVLMMSQFKCSIAHMAAIEHQASKAVEYTEGFVRKVKPFLEYHKIELDATNKRTISMVHPNGAKAYVQIIIATLTGANSPHTNILSIDEVDVMRFPLAYEEAKLIPGVFDGQFPLTVATSTRKFAFGMMEKEINNAKNSGMEVLRWNIIDITEKCPPQRHLPDQLKQIRYIDRDLPLTNLSREEFSKLAPEVQGRFEEIEAYAGCASCKLLPVCRTRLAHRPDRDVGGMYKPIDFTINQFKKLSPDMAAAQLMCWKPSLTGLIYKRFDDTEITGNTLTIEQAYQIFTGSPSGKAHITIEDLGSMMNYHEVRFRAGVDWGFRHFFVDIITAVVPNGDWWLIDCEAVSELEMPDKLNIGLRLQTKYHSIMHYPDPADPSSIKSFRRAGLRCASFKKDINGGIEAVRTQIIDGHGRRRLKVIKHERNEAVIEMFHKHHFKLDPAGNPTREPDDEEFADIGDSVRYIAQNLFGKSKAISPTNPIVDQAQNLGYAPQPVYHDWMSQKIRQMTEGQGQKGKSVGGGIIWDFTGDDPITED